MNYVNGFSVKKGRFYHAPPFRTLLLTNQGTLTFNNRSMITMALWKLHLEVGTLELVWMDMTPSLMTMERVLKRATLMKSNTKD